MQVEQSKYFYHIYPNEKTVYFGDYTTKNGRKIQHGNGFEYHNENKRRNHLYIGNWVMGRSYFGYLYSYNANDLVNNVELQSYRYDEKNNKYIYTPLSSEPEILKNISLGEIERRIDEDLFTDFINHFKGKYPSLERLRNMILKQLKKPNTRFTTVSRSTTPKKKSRFSTVGRVTRKSSTGSPSGGSKKRKHRKPKHRKRRTKAKKYK